MLRRSLGLILLASLLGGCVQRTLYVDTNPPGASVTMNGIDLGKTPLEKPFTYYGTFDVQVRKDGYDTLSTRTRVIAPWWQWPPFDFVAEFCPWHPKNRRHLAYNLTPTSAEPVDSQALIDRALTQREQLQSSEFTRKPATTQTATQPATTQAATLPTSFPSTSAAIVSPISKP